MNNAEGPKGESVEEKHASIQSAAQKVLSMMGSSKSSFIVIRGEMGTGKTSTLDTLEKSLLSRGYAIARATPSKERGGTLKKAFRGPLEEIVESGFEIIDIMFIHHSGVLMVSKELSESIDSDIVASMLQVVRSFIRDTFSKEGSDVLEEAYGMLSFEDHIIALYSVRDFGTFAVLLEGKIPQNLNLRMKNVVDRIKMEYHSTVLEWNGVETEEVRGMTELFGPIEELSEKKNVSFGEKEYNFINRFFTKLSEKLKDGSKIAILMDDAERMDELSMNIIQGLPKMYRRYNLTVVLASGTPLEMGGYESIVLNNMDYDSTKEFIESKTGSISEDLMKEIYEGTGGNPLLVSENIEILLNRGAEIPDESYEVISDFHRVAERKISRLSEDERELMSYLSLFGDYGIKMEYVGEAQKEVLKSLEKRGYVVLDSEIGFRYPEMAEMLREEAEPELFLKAEKSLEEDGKYRDALSMWIEHMKRAKDTSKMDEVLKLLSEWVGRMRKADIFPENPFLIIEEVLEFPGMKDSKELLRIMDEATFAVPNMGSFEEKSRIFRRLMDLAESLELWEIYARASYKYLRMETYKQLWGLWGLEDAEELKRRVERQLKLSEEIRREYDMIGASEEMYQRLENTVLDIKKRSHPRNILGMYLFSDNSLKRQRGA